MLLAFLAAGAVAGAARGQAAPKGLDVSNWQAAVNWLQVESAGYSFAFMKATEGTSFADPAYALHRAGATGVGIRVGAYHFARPAGGSAAAVVASAIRQADFFVTTAQPRPGDLLPVLDLERTGGLSVASLTAWTQAWLDEVAARLGVRPTLYASPSFWEKALGDTPVFAAAGSRLWIAHWTKAALPILPGGGWDGAGWTFWQWSDCQHVPGIVGCVDGDRFNGPTLAAAAVPPYPSGPPAAAAPPSIVGTPEAGRLLAAVPGQWSGGKPVSFVYQWQSCDAGGGGCLPIAGASAETYRPTAVEAGHALAVAVTAETAGGTATAVSPPTAAVASHGAVSVAAPRATTPPLIQGTAEVGQTLVGAAGGWVGSPTGFAFQWRRCAPDGSACSAIPNAVGSGYTVTPGDVGSTLALVVTVTGPGGTRSVSTPVTPVVTAAPVPPAAAGSTVAQPGQAGAVAAPNGVATASWQPGAVPSGATVGLGGSPSHLALPGTALTLRISAAAPLPWPVDVQYAAAPADAVPAFLPGSGVWRPLAQLSSSSLPAGQDAGAYRDASGALHVLTRRPGRLALFAPGKWGDPRFVSTTPPRLALVTGLTLAGRPDGSFILYARFTLSSQAHLYASVITPGGRRRALLLQSGSRLGWWVKGPPTKALQALQLRPGALPFRIHVPAGQLRAHGRYAVRLTAVDPYGRTARLLVPFTR